MRRQIHISPGLTLERIEAISLTQTVSGFTTYGKAF